MPIHPLVLAVSKGLTADALALLTGKSLPEDVLNAALWAAIKNNHPDLILTLLGHGADINGRFCQQDYNADSTSPLQYAVREGNHALAELLAAQGADLNRPAASHRAPLGEAVVRAVDKSDPAWIDWLLAQGADPNAGKRSAIPLALAAMQNRLDLMDRLKAAVAQVQPGLVGQKGQHFSYLRFIQNMESAASGRNIPPRSFARTPLGETGRCADTPRALRNGRHR
ncbi:MAG TPA: ankyrin repeat domain-containing protein [Anaerolineaceae bacterium]|nr:ankyrin repeat domain-containing protein [Anaerolineaceae bacterium]HPN54266.1 ankyrin repeat domain-containing protein [Anaerolineaceae bacterium]